jgi:signal transduction histidine kinase
MLSDSDRLLNTVEQVLEAGRIKERRRQFNVSEIDILDVIRSAIAVVVSRHNLAEHVIRFSGPNEELLVIGDPEELETAFINVLDNAVKYSGHDPRVSVRVKRAGLNKRIAILIRDSGIGIPAADLKRIFKRFYRVTSALAKETKGTGLGLHIVRSIIERHGGRIAADSKGEDQGTTFIIQLPHA